MSKVRGIKIVRRTSQTGCRSRSWIGHGDVLSYNRRKHALLAILDSSDGDFAAEACVVGVTTCLGES
jgi:hypothetical protein